MACDITTGRAYQCNNSLGGSKSIYFFNYLEDAFTIVAGEATAVNPLLTAVYQYEIEGDGNNLVEELVPDANTGTAVNTQTLTAILKKIDAASGLELNLMATGRPMAVLQDRNDVWHAIGLDDGLSVTVNQSTGSAKTDLNGYTLTAVSTTGSLSPKLDSATITAFEALVA
jgi:hypothetical protein